MSRCANCKHDECHSIDMCDKKCPMYTDCSEYSHCKCVVYDFDYNEDCPYFEEATNEI